MIIITIIIIMIMIIIIIASWTRCSTDFIVELLLEAAPLTAPKRAFL